MSDPGEEGNYAIFRDCLAELVTSRLAPSKPRRRIKARKNAIKPVSPPPPLQDGNDNDSAADLADFIDYLATEIFLSLPPSLRHLTHASLQQQQQAAPTPSLSLDRPDLSLPLSPSSLDRILGPLPPSIPDSFTTYALLPDSQSLPLLLAPVLEAYIGTASAAPPEYAPERRGRECEICGREHLPLTYHHLIPRQVADKAVRRGWVAGWEVKKVAWLCRACHSFVHKVASNEELARDWNSVEALGEREDVRAWAAWVGRVRWKKT